MMTWHFGVWGAGWAVFVAVLDPPGDLASALVLLPPESSEPAQPRERPVRATRSGTCVAQLHPVVPSWVGSHTLS